MSAAPLFPFGFALQYTSFALSNMTAEVHGAGSGAANVTITVSVTNLGSRASQVTVLFFARDPLYTLVSVPYFKRLVGFAKAPVNAGGSAVIEHTITAEDLATYDDAMSLRVVPGSYYLQASFDSQAPGVGHVAQL